MIVNVSSLIVEHPDAIASSGKLRGYLLDLYPDEKKATINVLVSCLECGIVDDIRNQNEIDSFAKEKYIAKLCNDYGFAEELATECITAWLYSFGKFIENKATASTQTKENIVDAIPESSIDECAYNPDDFIIDDGELLRYYGKQHSITIPNIVTRIGMGAFCSVTSLFNVIIPDGVTEVGEYAFLGCTNLTSIAIPDSVTRIRYSAFSQCTNLTKIIIPGSVTSIGDFAFNDCTSLANLIIPDNGPGIGFHAFDGCTRVKVQMPKSRYGNCGDVSIIGLTDEQIIWY